MAEQTWRNIIACDFPDVLYITEKRDCGTFGRTSVNCLIRVLFTASSLPHIRTNRERNDIRDTTTNRL